MPRNKNNSRGKRSKKDPSYYRPNFWRAASDVLIASMNRGQFPYAVLGTIFIVMIVKMPPDKVSELAFAILKQLQTLRLLGWALSLVLALGWFFSSKKHRKHHSGETKRIAGEKKFLQEEVVKRKLESSD